MVEDNREGGVGGHQPWMRFDTTRDFVSVRVSAIQRVWEHKTRPQAPQDLSNEGAPECVLCRALRGRRTRKPHLPHQEGPWRENNKQPRPRRPAALLFIGTKCGHRSLGRRETPGKL